MNISKIMKMSWVLKLKQSDRGKRRTWLVWVLLCGDLSEADDRVAKSNGSDIRGTWL